MNKIKQLFNYENFAQTIDYIVIILGFIALIQSIFTSNCFQGLLAVLIINTDFTSIMYDKNSKKIKALESKIEELENK